MKLPSAERLQQVKLTLEVILLLLLVPLLIYTLAHDRRAAMSLAIAAR